MKILIQNLLVSGVANKTDSDLVKYAIAKWVRDMENRSF